LFSLGIAICFIWDAGKLGSSSYPALMVRPNVVGQNNEQGHAPIYTTFIPQVVPVSHAIQYQGQVKQQKPRLNLARQPPYVTTLAPHNS